LFRSFGFWRAYGKHRYLPNEAEVKLRIRERRPQARAKSETQELAQSEIRKVVFAANPVASTNSVFSALSPFCVCISVWAIRIFARRLFAFEN
jgi:hypothetical protein